MNLFRLAGDMTHLASVLVLLHKIHTIKSCASISLKTQELYALFVDLMTRIIKTRSDITFLFCVACCLLLALLINERFTFMEIMWTFSLCLEAVAILLQLVYWFVGCMSAYRALYILNWIDRYFTEEHYIHWITWISGLIQTFLYADFFYHYFQSWKNNVKLQLPA